MYAYLLRILVNVCGFNFFLFLLVTGLITPQKEWAPHVLFISREAKSNMEV